MPLRFVLAKDPGGKFSFCVMSRNGQVLARSDAYSSRAGAQGAIRSIKNQAAEAEIEDQSTKAWADAQAAGATSAAPAPRRARKAGRRAAPVEAAAEAEAEPVDAPVDEAPEPEEEPEPEIEPETQPAFAEPTAVEEGPTRRLVSMRGVQGATEGRTPLRVSLRNPS